MAIFLTHLGTSVPFNFSNIHNKSHTYYLYLLFLVYAAIYGWLLVATDFRPYVMDNNESYSTLWHAYNLFHFDFFQSFGVTDEAFSPHAAAHPFLHTHQGNMPRLFGFIIYVLGARTIESQILITTLVIGTATLWMAYSYFSKWVNPLFSFIFCTLLITNYILYMQWHIVTYRVWHGFLIFSILLSLHGLTGKKPKLSQTGLFCSFLLLYYYELVFAVFVTFFSVFYLIFVYYPNLRLIAKAVITQAIGALTALVTLFTQLSLALGPKVVFQDFWLTFFARNDFNKIENFNSVKDFFESHNIAFWYNTFDGTPYRNLVSLVHSLSYYIFEVYTPYFSFLCFTVLLSAFIGLRFCEKYANTIFFSLSLLLLPTLYLMQFQLINNTDISSLILSLILVSCIFAFLFLQGTVALAHLPKLYLEDSKSFLFCLRWICSFIAIFMIAYMLSTNHTFSTLNRYIRLAYYLDILGLITLFIFPKLIKAIFSILHYYHIPILLQDTRKIATAGWFGSIIALLFGMITVQIIRPMTGLYEAPLVWKNLIILASFCIALALYKEIPHVYQIIKNYLYKRQYMYQTIKKYQLFIAVFISVGLIPFARQIYKYSVLNDFTNSYTFISITEFIILYATILGLMVKLEVTEKKQIVGFCYLLALTLVLYLFFINLMADNSIFGVKPEFEIIFYSIYWQPILLCSLFCTLSLNYFISHSWFNFSNLSFDNFGKFILFIALTILFEKNQFRLYQQSFALIWFENFQNNLLTKIVSYSALGTIMIWGVIIIIQGTTNFFGKNCISVHRYALAYFTFGLLAYTLVYCLSPGYIYTGYNHRYAPFSIFFINTIPAITIYLLIISSLKFLSLLHWRIKFMRSFAYIGSIATIVTLASYWFSLQFYYADLLPPTHYQFLANLRKPPFFGKSSIVNNYAAPVATMTQQWAYFDPKIATEANVRDTKTYNWLADHKINSDYGHPEYYICMMEQNFNTSLAKLTNNSIGYYFYGCSDQKIFNASNTKVVTQDSLKNNYWAIIKFLNSK